MIFWLIFAPLQIFAAQNQNYQENDPNLEFVQVIWRHGDRTPGELLHPSDISKWPQGIGELTEQGIQQQFRLGKWLNSRYAKWIGDLEMNLEKIYIRSSDYNRTLMSAQANMAGFFPPKTGIAHNIQWRPIPIHTMPREQDKELYESIKCPVAEKELENQWKSPKALNILKEFNGELAIIRRNLGEMVGIRDIWRVFDNFWCEKCNRIAWPTWMNDTVFERLEMLYHRISMLEYETEVLRRLRGGTLLSEIMTRFQQKPPNNLKFYAYSAHDSTIAALLSTLGIKFETFPKYATCLMLEMHKSGNLSENSPILRVFHKNETDSERVFEIFVPGCGEIPCRIERVQSLMRKYFPENWKLECGIVETNETIYVATIFVLIFTTCLSTTLLLLDRLKLKFRRKKSKRASADAIPMLEEEEIDSDEEI
ncbi:unnamed protein product [Caenorhabditis angaria]|uniref:Lysosomal acid phosphatase n=1 Tax=Caenorhabditis angaria TaxID=860376 RepID=A0A9P1N148_9PELO|nr:unnamed protein product [Caenorhabditis angaria]